MATKFRRARRLSRPALVFKRRADIQGRALVSADLAEDLSAALQRCEIEAHYQPIVRSSDRRILGMEALARWRHPRWGWVSPAVFLPVAHETGQLAALDDRIMRRACADASQWPRETILSLNISSVEFSEPGFFDRVNAALCATGLEPQRLQIEITDSELLTNVEATLAAMRRLGDLGVAFALDDFGAGGASLAYLKTFRFDNIKIDPIFVANISRDPRSIGIVVAIVALARGLDMTVTAEGVETLEQRDCLELIGVTSLQGYLIGRPAPNPFLEAERSGACTTFGNA